MGKLLKSLLSKLTIIAVLTTCQNSHLEKSTEVESSLSSDNGQLDLAQSTLEQQKMEKEKASKKLLVAREKRISINPEDLKDIVMDPTINIAIYARQTKNIIGEKSYVRRKRQQKGVNPCIRFMGKDDAQRYFLQTGGPEKDFFGLDPDGDGFACEWNPEPFKKIKIP